MTIAAGVAFVQQSHGFDTKLTGFLDEGEQLSDTQFVVGGGFESFLHKCQDALIARANQVGMVDVSCHALEPVDCQLAQRADVRVEGRVIHNADGAGFFEQGFDFVILRVPASPIGTAAAAIGIVQLVAASLGTGAQFVTQLDGFFDHVDKTLRVKIGVGDRGEKCLGDEKVGLIVLDAHTATAGSPERDTLEQVNEQVLQAGNFGSFPTHALADVASGVAHGFLALKTKHFCHKKLLTVFFYIDFSILGDFEEAGTGNGGSGNPPLEGGRGVIRGN